ncbi:MAG: hypothetical protein FWH21_00145 [Kiritimatiellaeota bacterium]|nr:hypothetical protein [Kiritimatiellota bacterium]
MNTVQTDLNTAAQVYTSRFIECIELELERIGSFSLDFSSEFINHSGETVVVPLVKADEAEEWDDAANNYIRPVATLKDTKVTISQRPIAGFAVSPVQVATFQPTYWEGKARLNARSVGLKIVNAMFGLVTAANFPEEEVVTLAAFNKGKVGALRALVTRNGMAPGDCVVVLNPAYFTALLVDLDASVYGGREAILSGHLPGLFGFRDFVEAPNLTIPGFIAYPSALAGASRLLRPLRTDIYDVFETSQDGSTGFAFNTVVATEIATGKTSMSVESNFGVAVGDPGEDGRQTLVRLVETATPEP